MLPTMAQVAGKQEEELLVERLTKELEEVTASLEPHFSRREAHEAATSYVKGLLSRAERKNSSRGCWLPRGLAGVVPCLALQPAQAIVQAVIDVNSHESSIRQDMASLSKFSPGSSARRGGPAAPRSRGRDRGGWRP
jgi:hypothetical protein